MEPTRTALAPVPWTINGRLFVSVKELAGLSDTDPRTVRRGIANGDIPSVTISNSVRIPVAWVLAHLEMAGDSVGA